MSICLAIPSFVNLLSSILLKDSTQRLILWWLHVQGSNSYKKSVLWIFMIVACYWISPLEIEMCDHLRSAVVYFGKWNCRDRISCHQMQNCLQWFICEHLQQQEIFSRNWIKKVGFHGQIVGKKNSGIHSLFWASSRSETVAREWRIYTAVAPAPWFTHLCLHWFLKWFIPLHVWYYLMGG